jgi:hypothetical protein
MVEARLSIRKGMNGERSLSGVYQESEYRKFIISDGRIVSMMNIWKIKVKWKLGEKEDRSNL